MKFAGMQKTSFIDYPGELCTVLFSAGCNFRCAYCHNAELLHGENCMDEEEIIRFLLSRKKNIDALCISGGEVTLQKELLGFIRRVKGLGFKVKLDTNGTNYLLLEQLIQEQLLDFIAMDIKAPLGKYADIIGVPVDESLIQGSVRLIQQSGVKYEFRTTVVDHLFQYEDLESIAHWLKGSECYALQNFRDNENVLVGEGQLKPFDANCLKHFKNKYEEYFGFIDLRI